MGSYINDIMDSLKYAVSDWKVIVILGIILVANSIVSKYDFISSSLWRSMNFFMIFVVGYGSYVSWNTLKGSDKLPDFKNPKKLFWEGLKKSLIIFIYSIPLTYIIHIISTSDNRLILIIATVAFMILYLIMIAALLNRYFHHGEFLKAFSFFEIADIVSIFNFESFLKVFIPVLISHVFVVSIVLQFDKGFTAIEIAYSLFVFLLAPVLFLAAKRLVGIQIRKLLQNNDPFKN